MNSTPTTCPLCRVALAGRARCPSCKLLWERDDASARLEQAPGDTTPTDDPPAVRIVRHPSDVWGCVVFIVAPIALFCLGAAACGLWLLVAAPSEARSWVCAALTIPFGLFLGVPTAGGVIATVIDAIVPETLESRGETLRVRLRAGVVRRTDVWIDRRSIEAVYQRPCHHEWREVWIACRSEPGYRAAQERAAFRAVDACAAEEAQRLFEDLDAWVKGTRRGEPGVVG